MSKNKLSKLIVNYLVFFLIFIFIYFALKTVFTCMGQCPAWEITFWNNLNYLLWLIYFIITAYFIYKALKDNK